MAWSRRLDSPIFLNDGRTIAALADARDLILDLPKHSQRSPRWRYATALLLDASRKQSAIPEAEAQLRVALKAEGLI